MSSTSGSISPTSSTFSSDTKPNIDASRRSTSTATPTSTPTKKGKGGNTTKQEPDSTPDPNTPDLPTPPKKPRLNASKGTHKAKSSTDEGARGEWSPDKREAIVSKIIVAGMKAHKVKDLADEFGVTERQVYDLLQGGKPGNLRGKLLRCAQGA